MIVLNRPLISAPALACIRSATVASIVSLVAMFVSGSITGAFGEGRGPAIPSVSGGKSEMIEPQATVVSENHYQATFTLTCASTICSLHLPAVVTDRRLNVRWVSCAVTSVPSALFLNGSFQVRNNNQALLLTQFIGSTIHSVAGVHILNQEMDVIISANRHGFILLQVTGGTIGGATCTLNGALQTLQ